MLSFHRSAALAATLALSLGVLSGCANFATTTSDSAKLDIQATSNSIYEGEIVTLTTRTVNTFGTGAKLEWSCSGGKLSTEKSDRIARVKFDQPGSYIVTAKLVVDGRVVATDHVEVRVRGLTDYDQG